MMRYCRSGSASARISPAAWRMSAGSRNSSTNFIMSPEPVSFELLHRLGILAEHREQPQLLARRLFADEAHGESDVDQHPVARSNPFPFEQADVDLAPHFGHFDY